MAVFGIFVLRWLIALLFGGQVASHLLALVLHDILLFPFRIIGLFLRRR